VVLAVGIAATACGGDDGAAVDGGAAGSDGPAATSAPATASPVPATSGADTTAPPATRSVPLSPPGPPATRAIERPEEAAPGVPLVGSPAEVEEPAGAKATADLLLAVEHALRDPATPPAARPSLGWHQQVGYRALARNPEWLPDVHARLPPDVALVVERNVGSGTRIGTLVDPPKTLPTAWRIVAPRPARELLGYYREAEAEFGIPWAYLAAINLVETRMGRIVGDSTAGAQGPMQFIPSTWEAFGAGGDVHDPHDAILGAGRYLAASGGPGDMRAALFAYNRADAYVDAVTGYAQNMLDDERAYYGYYHWQVTYRTVDGLYLLPVGYPDEPAVPLG
jgi:soluble lytic murein transglycosylase-like protein